MARTKKPCPLCKERHLRDADDVCIGCRRKHDRLLKYEAELEARGELEIYNIPTSDWPGRAPFQFHISKELYQALSKMLLAVTPLNSQPCTGTGNFIPYFQHYYTKTEPRLLTAEAAQSIKDFFNLMQSEFERCASFSIQQGKNLLCQFASGGVTADELNQAGIKDGRL